MKTETGARVIVDKLSEQAAATIPTGGFRLTVVSTHAPKLSRSSPRREKVIGEADANHVQAITGALAYAQPAGRKQRLTKPRW